MQARRRPVAGLLASEPARAALPVLLGLAVLVLLGVLAVRGSTASAPADLLAPTTADTASPVAVDLTGLPSLLESTAGLPLGDDVTALPDPFAVLGAGGAGSCRPSAAVTTRWSAGSSTARSSLWCSCAVVPTVSRCP